MNFTSRRGLTFVDLIVVLTLLAFASLVAIPQLSANQRDIANRIKCSANLRSMGQALLLYANDNNGNYPRTRYDRKHPIPTQYTGWAAANPFGSGGPSVNDVTASLYLLIRGDYLTPGVCVCPADSGAKIWNYNGGSSQSVSNFPDNKGLSYSIQNSYAEDAAINDGFVWKNTLGSGFAVAADMNPGTPEVLTVTPQTPLKQLEAANSPNHERTGQGILFGDGHVQFFNTPFAGIGGDNIYGAAKPVARPKFRPDPMAYTINASPAHHGDSVLLPTYSGAVRQYSGPSMSASTIVMFLIMAAFVAAGVFLAIYAMRDRKVPVIEAA